MPLQYTADTINGVLRWSISVAHRALLIGVLAIASFTAGCAANDAETEQLRERVAELEAAQASTTVTVEATTSTRLPQPTTTSTQAPSSSIEATAELVLEGLSAQGAPISGYVNYTASTDPNELLGRPGGYSSKVNFADERVESRAFEPFELTGGGSIEVFATESGATQRAQYLREIVDAIGLFGNEYHIQRGIVLLRLSEGLVPEEVADYESWLDGAIDSLDSGVKPPPFVASQEEEPVSSAEAAAADSSTFVAGTFGDELPGGEDGEVVVIAQGSEVGSTVPIIVRNMTPDSIIRIEVAATARDSSGTLLASGSSQGLNPNLVAPGEIAFGYVYFGFDAPVNSSSVIEYSVTHEASSASFAQFENIRDLTPREWSRSGQSIVAIFTNGSGEDLSGPFGVNAACFSTDGTFTGVSTTFADSDSATAGDHISAQIRIIEPCDLFLIAGSGFTD